jgi:hypothetical protein
MQIFAKTLSSKKKIQTSCTKPIDIFISTYEKEPTRANTHGSDAIRVGKKKVRMP